MRFIDYVLIQCDLFTYVIDTVRFIDLCVDTVRFIDYVLIQCDLFTYVIDTVRFIDLCVDTVRFIHLFVDTVRFIDLYVDILGRSAGVINNPYHGSLLLRVLITLKNSPLVNSVALFSRVIFMSSKVMLTALRFFSRRLNSCQKFSALFSKKYQQLIDAVVIPI